MDLHDTASTVLKKIQPEKSGYLGGLVKEVNVSLPARSVAQMLAHTSED